MNEITYFLCNTKILGIFFYAANACSFPPLAKNIIFPIDKPNATVTIAVDSPVSHEYAIEMAFSYTEEQRAKIERLNSSQGPSCKTKFHSKNEIDALTLTNTIPLRIILLDSTRKPLQDFFVSGNCGIAWWSGHQVGKVITTIPIKKGKHFLTIHNIAPPKEISGFPATISVTAGLGK